MLLKPITTLVASACIAAACAVAMNATPATSPPANSIERVINIEGLHSPSFTRWKLDAKLGKPLSLKHDGVGVSMPSIKLKPNWFAYIDTKEQAWVYDGENDITIYAIIKDKTPTPSTCVYCLCSYKGEIPDEVKSRVKPAIIHRHPQHNQSLQRTPGSGVRSTL